ncbi:MAG: hypothetical protein KAU10_00290, partial [Dehalococcoidia bacterium]|nr:hypothetical protein [Dehalococcoidia bacterium]
MDPEGIPISTTIGHQVSPSVAFDGANWLIVWQDCRNRPHYYEGDIYAARVTQSGEVLDPEGFPITTAADSQRDPKLAFGEENYLVVWHGPGGDGARVSPTGVVLDPDGLDLLGMVTPAVAFGGTDWLAVKASPQGSYQFSLIKGVLVDPFASVQPLPDRIGVGFSPISVAFGETSWLVAWPVWYVGGTWPDNIIGARVSQSGEILGSAFRITSFLECAVELREQGTILPIDEIQVGEFFDIYIQASTVDTNITEVRFSSDDWLDGQPNTSWWTDWYDWNTSSEDWNHITKTKAWALTTTGGKEVWVEVKDDVGDTSQCYARIFILGETGTVTGRVTDATTGHGIASATVVACPSTHPFPHKGDLSLPQGTTIIPENAVTGIEEGDLYIPSGATLHLKQNATFIWNPGYSIHTDGEIVLDPGAHMKKGYLCVSV